MAGNADMCDKMPTIEDEDILVEVNSYYISGPYQDHCILVLQWAV